MVEGTSYQVIIAQPAQIRYQNEVLTYLIKHFSLTRAIEIDANITDTIASLGKMPHRGKIEELLRKADRDFKFILYKETQHFELKILYYVNDLSETVFVTDIFPTAMDPSKMSARS